MPNDVSIARYIPPMSLPDIERLAHAMARSQLFGIRNVDQALALMAISQAEGRHPALAARDYDIIQGRPSKKTEAMLRDFLSSGGSVEWHALTDTDADATFSHPTGGTVRLAWDMKRAKQAGIVDKDMWRKYPRQMLRSRCVSEGIRTVCPMATSGMYVPEEVADFGGAKRRRPEPETIDHEERRTSHEPHDPETGELLASHALALIGAQVAAPQGTAHFREYLRDLSRAERAVIAPMVGTSANPGPLLTVAMEADALAANPPVSPAGDNPPTGAEMAPPPTPAGGPHSVGLYSLHVPLSKTPTDNELASWEQRIDELLSDGHAPADIVFANEVHLARLKDIDPLYYGMLMVKLGQHR